MPVLKSLTFTSIPERRHDPVEARRAKLIARHVGSPAQSHAEHMFSKVFLRRPNISFGTPLECRLVHANETENPHGYAQKAQGSQGFQEAVKEWPAEAGLFLPFGVTV